MKPEGRRSAITEGSLHISARDGKHFNYRPIVNCVVAISNFTVGIEIRRRGDRSRHVRTSNFEIQPL